MKKKNYRVGGGTLEIFRLVISFIAKSELGYTKFLGVTSNSIRDVLIRVSPKIGSARWN